MTGPYIVTTKRHEAERDHGDGPAPYGIVSRCAVATLEEAREHIWDHHGRGLIWPTLPESGGAVGPLPDGTVIEVERASWDDLVGPNGWNTYSTTQSVCDAYNAQQKATA